MTEPQGLDRGATVTRTLGFSAGAALSASSVGVALLWIAVLAQFGGLAAACAQI